MRYDIDGFSDRLRLARRKAGLKQRGLSVVKGVSVSRVSCWENGTSLPPVKLIVPLAKELGVSPVWLIFGIGGMYDEV